MWRRIPRVATLGEWDTLSPFGRFFVMGVVLFVLVNLLGITGWAMSEKYHGRDPRYLSLQDLVRDKALQGARGEIDGLTLRLRDSGASLAAREGEIAQLRREVASWEEEAAFWKKEMEYQERVVEYWLRETGYWLREAARWEMNYRALSAEGDE